MVQAFIARYVICLSPPIPSCYIHKKKVASSVRMKKKGFSFHHLPYRFCAIHDEATEGSLFCIPANLQLTHTEAELCSKCNYLVFGRMAPPNSHYISYTFLTWKPCKISELFCEGEKCHLIRPHVQRSIWLRAQQFTQFLELSWRQAHDPLRAETLGHGSRCTSNIF